MVNCGIDKFIFSSSCAVYGNPTGKLISEKEIFSDQLISILHYRDSKEYKIYSILNNKLSIISLKN